jgi:hypothetical protein
VRWGDNETRRQGEVVAPASEGRDGALRRPRRRAEASGDGICVARESIETRRSYPTLQNIAPATTSRSSRGHEAHSIPGGHGCLPQWQRHRGGQGTCASDVSRRRGALCKPLTNPCGGIAPIAEAGAANALVTNYLSLAESPQSNPGARVTLPSGETHRWRRILSLRNPRHRSGS